MVRPVLWQFRATGRAVLSALPKAITIRRHRHTVHEPFGGTRLRGHATSPSPAYGRGRSGQGGAGGAGDPPSQAWVWRPVASLPLHAPAGDPPADHLGKDGPHTISCYGVSSKVTRGWEPEMVLLSTAATGASYSPRDHGRLGDQGIPVRMEGRGGGPGLTCPTAKMF